MPTPTDQKEYDKVVEIVKKNVSRFPSAYASGQIVQEYKRRMALKGLPAYKEPKPKTLPPLIRWFKEKWVDIATGKPCGMAKSNASYPTCRPTIRVNQQTPTTVREMTAEQKKKAIEAKQIAKKKTTSLRL